MLNQILDLIGVPNEQSPVPGRLADEDLERMLMGAVETGDQGRAERIRKIKQMRGHGYNPEQMQEQEQGQPNKFAQFGANAADARQQLLDALITRPNP